MTMANGPGTGWSPKTSIAPKVPSSIPTGYRGEFWLGFSEFISKLL
uniref:Uncharacterized protein n=1 Tax=Arundo donax TaxID=35708 RepID=A0A0A9TER6_ARUDO